MRLKLLLLAIGLSAGCAHQPPISISDAHLKPTKPLPRLQRDLHVEYFPASNAGAARNGAGWQHALVPHDDNPAEPAAADR